MIGARHCDLHLGLTSCLLPERSLAFDFIANELEEVAPAHAGGHSTRSVGCERSLAGASVSGHENPTVAEHAIRVAGEELQVPLTDSIMTLVVDPKDLWPERRVVAVVVQHVGHQQVCFVEIPRFTELRQLLGRHHSVGLDSGRVRHVAPPVVTTVRRLRGQGHVITRVMVGAILRALCREQSWDAIGLSTIGRSQPEVGMKLSGKVALVTGASRGIGRGIAEALGAEGASIAVNYLQRAPAAAEVVEVIRSSGVDAIAVQADIAEEDDVQRMVDAVLDRFGRIDVLVNNAGVLTQSHLADMPVAMWDEMIRTNLRGAFLCSRAVLPGMLAQGGGRIIYVASQLGLKGAPDLVHYSAAKAALIGMTRALAREVAPTVTVNAIAPGPIETDMLANITEEWKAIKLAELPLARFGLVSEVAPTAVFLASDDAAYYTGQVLGPNGGDVMP